MDNSNISKRLENIRAHMRSMYNSGQSSNPSKEDKKQVYTGSLPPDVIPVNRRDPNTDLRIAQTFRLPMLPEKFNKIPSLDALIVSKDDFLDSEWADRPTVRLTTLTNQQVCQLRMFLLHSLQTRISRQGVAVIFVLAVYLRAPRVGSTERIFEATDPYSKPSNPHSDFEDVLVPTRESIQASEHGDVVENAKAYSFLAALMLRLFTLSPKTNAQLGITLSMDLKLFTVVIILLLTLFLKQR